MLLLQSDFIIYPYPKHFNVKNTNKKIIDIYKLFNTRYSFKLLTKIQIKKSFINLIHTIYQYSICPITFCSLCKMKEMNIYKQPEYYYYDNSLKRIIILKQN